MVAPWIADLCDLPIPARVCTAVLVEHGSEALGRFYGAKLPGPSWDGILGVTATPGLREFRVRSW